VSSYVLSHFISDSPQFIPVR